MPISSMTGFGVASVGGVRVEARSVNARFLEVKLRHPFGPEAEARLRKRVESSLGRGRVELRLSLDARDEASASSWRASVEETLDMLREVVGAVVDVGLEVGPVNPLELLESARRSGSEARPEVGMEVLEAAVDAALSGLLEMRSTEGASLERALKELVDDLEATVARVSTLMVGEPERLLEARRAALSTLLERVGAEGELAADDPSLLREVALLVQKGDVREEVDRLESHFAQLRGVLAAPASRGQGKRLDFLTQELLREVTTMGSKITSHAGSAELIEAKAIIERLREQVQNVE